ncbi:MAG TPA: bifunctional (p)ppGpp synthetase/guanosine-3',5'-bis(diphosphate) 3'-pyrophosphohydrolase [Rhodocyclaceae bacterium]|jgi:GTP pyrophosphokinase/guanosine-3',5'-bis(diphosphate) 3'-pyrophosphohydrolase|nr:bifunctional (p)ppGpp synthetase/guanosine-3',5'-bis(diphosphate) 3'-pyrophosphohydrolase [Rhodocyclaceae bacterium]HNL20382.1 bifunctional (p)ppGpp synthetase/guanosine-3',5'-bis(diphosphate) 3'-pyrophosphohydrolase [Rhodocyclaceae bacterium]HNM22057.1 bifunctional (p)ppGpp synthetase/guanosine-3',5'-bis(diphosphate) 3'-pyrophosphohydrolase [Rhodocyclaceae bacterium]HNM80637.1 bifunctional (p)ppGpp synthetase/guanosine-3',5'-bis(diphosphate) 3'-pyrophosphohydrolase [Rhodocyclaceae bacterium]
MDPAPPLPTPSVEDPDFRAFVDSLVYLSPAEVRRIREAYAYSARAHANQKRLSGEPYITHPLAVAGAVVEWRMDTEAIMAALLHDVLEDTGATKRELTDLFGREVAELVDGLSKLDKMEFASYHEAQAENFRKMLMAMARDLRVVLIKLADRQHNLATMAAVRPDKQRRIASETLEIYAPIALRLGLNKLYRELQDNCFRLLHPHRAEVLAKAVRAARGNRRELLAKITDGIRGKLQSATIEADVFGREKTLYSIYRKMKEKQLSFSQVLDIYGFRVVVGSVPACYLALGALHALYKPVPGKFKDYIAIPKANGYQSLHTTLIGPYGTPVEVQIRTESMHHVAQEGIAAHWLYKDTEQSGAELQIKTHKWLQSLLEMQSGDSAEFFENVKIDLFPDEVYVFTPKGKILALPRGATVVDFAYAVHTDVGNHCTAARINHELAPLRTELKNGDLVEIITAPHASPNPAWLTYIKTGRSRSKIRHFLRTMQNEESASLGERLLNQELMALGVVASMVPNSAWEQLLKNSGNKSRDEVFTDIGLGKRLPSVVARRLLARDDAPAAEGGGALTIRGTEGMAIQLAKCCQPIPGDPIIGSIRKGHGLVVHTHDCPTIRISRSSEPQKWIDVEWEPEEGALFDVRIRVEVKNTRGVLAQVAAAIAEAGSNIEDVSMDASPERLFTSLGFTIQVANRAHLAQVLRGLRHIPEVSRIYRDRGGQE